MEYNSYTNRFEGEIQISDGGYCYDSYMYSCNPAGTRKLNSIDVLDKSNNSISYSSSDIPSEILKGLEFEVLDLDDPKVIASSISLDRTHVTIGDVIRVSMKGLVSDYSYHTKRVELEYRSENDCLYCFNRVTLEFNGSEYVGDIPISQYTENGFWDVKYATIYDGSSYTTVYPGDKITDTKYVDMSGGTFYVEGTTPDHEAPIIDVTSLKVNKINALAGDVITFSLKITDNLSGVSSLHMQLVNDKGSYYYAYSSYIDEKSATVTFTIPKSMEVGHWQIKSISAYDNCYNSIYLYDERLDNHYLNQTADLSGGDFVVLPEELKDFTITPTGEIIAYKGQVNELTVPSEVGMMKIHEIKDEVFINNTSITKLILSYGIQTIGAKSFYNCSNLEILEVPSSLQSIGTDSFTQTDKLNTVIINYGEGIIDSLGFTDWKSFIEVIQNLTELKLISLIIVI